MIKICSGWNPTGSMIYGRRFLDSFDQFWSPDIALEVYVEQPEEMPRGACRDLWSIPGAIDCRQRYATAPTRGQMEPEKRTWKSKEKAAGYSFRFDAEKFWKQILIPSAAALTMDDGDILVWLDGDVETIAPVPIGFVPDLLGIREICYLGREPKHSEIGFWAVRLNKTTRAFLAGIAGVYISGSVIDLEEWHSAFAWDHVRRIWNMSERNLCRPGARGHVFPQSPLAPYLRHDKGKRKPGAKA